MTTSKQHNKAEEAINRPTAFEPRKPEPLSNPIQIQGQWKPMLESDCDFEPEMFLRVMHNLIKNPNIMSSHLFRADIFYDSENDHTIIEGPGTPYFSDFTRHLKQEYRPKYIDVPGYKWQRTYVRQLVPRNRQLDKDLVQTCNFYAQQEGSTVRNIILYVPHVETPKDMPWYHPKVQMVAFFHESTAPTSHPHLSQNSGAGTVSVHFSLFSVESLQRLALDERLALDKRLERTALQLLTTIHKHGRGQQTGYQKRVHHDQILPQQRFQETYARLKAKYAKSLITNWAEETDPGKHVFEDLGIAAFLIELWADMYDCGTTQDQPGNPSESTGTQGKPWFPGFVDIGCGNGLLVNLLIMEGYRGWGFDARQRKTWKTFAPDIQKQVTEMVLVPEVLQPTETSNDNSNQDKVDNHPEPESSHQFHNGMFEKGTFIVSNHADELTPWTPLLAHLNDSPFIAIPCCSHNLAGARWRAHPSKQAKKNKNNPQEQREASAEETTTDNLRSTQAAETGSLKKPGGGKNMPSAYASLCDYVIDVASEVGFIPEKEVLRIPSTRNMCILGRKRDLQSLAPEQLDESLSNGEEATLLNEKKEQIRKILARELNSPIDDICRDWVKRAQQIAGKKGDGH